MPNRFGSRIKAGEIASVEELKAEFKALAKETHPDLAGPEAAEEFIRARAEYEAALRDFERHRFGLSPTAGEKARSARDRGSAGAEALGLFAALGVLRKRGFPKRPRHEKEGLRYEYARWRFLRALEPGGPSGRLASFEAFEAALLGRRDRGEPLPAALLDFLDELLAYARRGHPAMRTSLVLALGRLRAEASLEPELLAFLELLAAELGIGAVLT